MSKSSSVSGSGATAITTSYAGTVPINRGGTNLTAYAQGDILYASAANVLASLAKDGTATRYLSNTGATNNPAWAQVNAANGITGTLPVANGGSGAASLAAGPSTVSKLTRGTLSAQAIHRMKGSSVNPQKRIFWRRPRYYRPGAPQTGNHRLRSGSIFRSDPTWPRTSSSSALSRRSPDSGANG